MRARPCGLGRPLNFFGARRRQCGLGVTFPLKRQTPPLPVLTCCTDKRDAKRVESADVMVGRSKELRQVSRVLSGAGRERVALVIGDAGIGKSRLVREVAVGGETGGRTVITGACLPLSESLPLLPSLRRCASC